MKDTERLFTFFNTRAHVKMTWHMTLTFLYRNENRKNNFLLTKQCLFCYCRCCCCRMWVFGFGWQMKSLSCHSKTTKNFVKHWNPLIKWLLKTWSGIIGKLWGFLCIYHVWWRWRNIVNAPLSTFQSPKRDSVGMVFLLKPMHSTSIHLKIVLNFSETRSLHTIEPNYGLGNGMLKHVLPHSTWME